MQLKHPAIKLFSLILFNNWKYIGIKRRLRVRMKLKSTTKIDISIEFTNSFLFFLSQSERDQTIEIRISSEYLNLLNQSQPHLSIVSRIYIRALFSTLAVISRKVLQI